MMAKPTAAESYKPPYLSFRTFKTFIERLTASPLPPRIDRGFLSNLDGTSQTSLLNTLRAWRLVREDGTVEDSLKELVQADEDTRKKLLADLFRAHYPEQIALGEQNATSQQLEESFRNLGVSGSTHRKAVTFYLHAADYLGLPTSAYFKPPKQEAAPRRKVAPKKRRAPRTPAQLEPEEGDEHEITLPSGATVRLVLSERLLKLPRDERQFVLDVIDTLDAQDSAEDADDSFPDAGEVGVNAP
jgi:hypothetical protein